LNVFERRYQPSLIFGTNCGTSVKDMLVMFRMSQSPPMVA
jgi:hypothetical protein